MDERNARTDRVGGCQIGLIFLDSSDWEKGKLEAFIELPAKAINLDAHIIQLDLDRWHHNPAIVGIGGVRELPVGKGHGWLVPDKSGFQFALYFPVLTFASSKRACDKLKTGAWSLVATVKVENDEGAAWDGELLSFDVVAAHKDAADPIPPRALETVSDDDIVEAIARYGILGIDLDDTDPGNAIEQICIELGLLFEETRSEDERDMATLPFIERVHAMCDVGEGRARISIPIANRLMLTPYAWASRLIRVEYELDAMTKMLGGRTAGEWAVGVVDSMYVGAPVNVAQPSPY